MRALNRVRALNPVNALTSLVPDRGPQRAYGLAMLINTFGFGLVMTAIALYASRVVHLSAGQIGLGLTIAGLVGLLAAIPIGDLADRRGPRGVVRAITLLQALSAFAYVLVHNFAGFVIVATVDLLALTAAEAADGALTARVSGGEPAAFRARIQAIANLGISLGALGCGVAVQVNTPDAYRALIVFNALTFLVSWVILGRLPHYEPLPKPESGPRLRVLADKAFLAYTAASGAMYIQYFVIVLALPLWIVDHTRAPRWTISLLVLINTVLVILCQVRVGRKVETVRQGGHALRRAGVIFLFSCSAFGAAAGLPGWAALLVLVGAVALHTYGELWHGSGSYALDFGLAPPHAQGQYQGMIAIGTGAGQAAAPVVLIGLCLSLGRVGWVGLGACFALLGLAAPVLARWGERSRPPAPAADDAGEPSPTAQAGQTG